MTARRRPNLPEGGLLNWRDTAHWSGREKPCRYCEHPTHLRDSKRSPAHKTCAEAALSVQATAALATYQNGTL